MVLPDSVDFEVAHGYAFATKSQLADDGPARCIARQYRDLHSMQTKLFKGEPEQNRARLGDIAVAGERLINPVTDIAGLERTALDRGDVDLAGESVADEHPEPESGPEMSFAIANRAPRGEIALVFGRIRRARGAWFPLHEPRTRPCTNLAPRRKVLGLERPKGDPSAAELRRVVMKAHSTRCRKGLGRPISRADGELSFDGSTPPWLQIRRLHSRGLLHLGALVRNEGVEQATMTDEPADDQSGPTREVLMRVVWAEIYAAKR